MSLPAPYFQDEAVTIYHADCRHVVPFLGSFDLLLTDPPYGLNYDPCGRKHLAAIQHEKVHGDDQRFDAAWLLPFAKAAILWGANCYPHSLPEDARWLAWDKATRNGLDIRMAEMELAWTNCVNKPRIFRHLWTGAYRATEQKSRLHPTQKPLELMRWCIGLVPWTATILDPFAGSGTTGRAAKDLGKQATLIEREERYCEIAARRMSQQVLALT